MPEQEPQPIFPVTEIDNLAPDGVTPRVADLGDAQELAGAVNPLENDRLMLQKQLDAEARLTSADRTRGEKPDYGKTIHLQDQIADVQRREHLAEEITEILIKTSDTK